MLTKAQCKSFVGKISNLKLLVDAGKFMVDLLNLKSK